MLISSTLHHLLIT